MVFGGRLQKFGGILGVLVGLTACSSLESWRALNAEHRHFEVRKVWVRAANETPNVGYRKINRMTPILTGTMLLTGNSIDGLVAWDRDSGRELWRLKTVNGIEGGATLIRDRLFFGASDGQFYSVDVRHGKVLWTAPVKGEVLSEPFLDSENGIVFVQTASSAMVAMEADSGKIVWLYSRQDANNFSVRGTSRPVLKDGTLYAGFSDGYLVALNARSGLLKWEVQLNRRKKFKDVDTSPLIDGDRLYVAGYDDRLYCLSAEKGDILWRMDGGGYFGLTSDGNRLYYPTSDGQVKALNRENGQTLWTYQVPDGIATSVVKLKGLLVFGESQGKLRFLDASSGKQIGSFEPGRGIFSTPLVEEKTNRVYFISGESNVYALEAGWKL